MKKFILLTINLIVTVLSFGQELKTFNDYDGYIPNSVNPIVTSNSFKDFKGKSIDIDRLKLTDFNYLSTNVTVLDQNDKIGGFGITFEKDTYKLLYTFENYIEVFDDNNRKLRIGSSIEVEAIVKTKKANLDLSDLFSLAINAEKKKIQGSISMTAKGFSSENIYGLFNINSSINRASIQQILKNVGIAISKFTDNTVKLKPVILGYESKRGLE